VVDKGTADEGGYTAGDRATVLVSGAPMKVTITGIARFAGADSPGGANFVMFTLESAQTHIGEIGKVDTVSVAADKGVSQKELAARIDKVLPGGIEAITGEKYIKENQDTMQDALSFFDQFMFVFGAVALLVGAFIIFNTFFITVVQRTKELALMRAIGASRRQVLLSVLLEALVIGVVASAVGLGLGVLVAVGLKALLAAFGLDIPAGGVAFSPGTAVLAFTVGVVVTLIAALSPARKAGKVPPIAAMRDVTVTSTGYGSKQRIFVGAGVLAVGVGGLLYGLLGSPDNALPIVGLCALLVFFGVSILGRTVALPMSRAIGSPLPRLRGVEGRLARENVMRSPKRTAATASALMIGVGLVSFITIFAASTKTSFGKIVDKSFNGDLIVTAPGQFGGGGVSPELTAKMRDLPEIETAGGIRVGVAKISGTDTQILAAEPAVFDIFDVDPVAGSPKDLDARSIAVHDEMAASKGLKLGDTVTVRFALTGPQKLRVGLIYGENQPAGDWLLPTATAEANFPEQQDIQVFVKKADGTSSKDALAAVERAAKAYPGTKVLDQSQYKEEQLAFVDQILGLVYALLALAIVIALMGIANALALSIFERTRELGVLRAVGMTRRQLRSTIRWESVIIAVQGAVLGLLIGVFFGWALVKALEDEGLNTLSIPMTSLLVVLVLAAIAGVVAAVLPARRAAHLDVLRAIVSE
jgi:putative ABC transport system permease protein